MTDFEELVLSRRSVRGFKDQPVPDDVLKKIFSQAQLAPSGCNAQPWRCYVLSGQARYNISRALVNAVIVGEPLQPDFKLPLDSPFPQIYQERQHQCAAALYTAMGIAREDKSGRSTAFINNFKFFNAPHVAFIFMHKNFSEIGALDIGIYVQTLALAMTNYGVSSCIQESLGFYPHIVRQFCDVPEDYNLVIGISFGFEDRDVAANNAQTHRAPLLESTVFME